MTLPRNPRVFDVLTGTVFLIPPVGVAATMGVVPLFLVAGLCALRIAVLRGQVKACFPMVLTALVVAFTAYGCLSAVWALDPFRALSLTAKLGFLSLCGMVVIGVLARLEGDERRRIERALLAGFLFAALLMAVAVIYATITDDSLWSNHSGDPLTTISKGETILGLLLWPVAAALWRESGTHAAAACIAMAIGGFFFLPHVAVLASLAAGAAACFAVMLFKRRAAVIMGLAFSALILLAPLLMRAVPSGDVMFEKVGSVYPSAVHRIYMWHFVTDRIAERPILGWGMDSSRRIPGAHEKLRKDPLGLWKQEILPLHPHNVVLQTWLELGLVGAALMAVLVALVFVQCARSGTPLFETALCSAVATGYLAAGSLSYGAWQNWWFSFGWIAAALVLAVSLEGKSRMANGGD